MIPFLELIAASFSLKFSPFVLHLFLMLIIFRKFVDSYLFFQDSIFFITNEFEKESFLRFLKMEYIMIALSDLDGTELG